MAESNEQLIPIFKSIEVPNEAKSKKAGRPIVDDLEVVEIRYPGDRQKVTVFPATEIEPNATREAAARGEGPVTYAEVFSRQYRAFKDRQTQTVSGTPLSELPFLTNGKRSELRALNIQTAEQLAALDGNPLKQLGMGGRELKNQAKAYLDSAAGSADVTEQAATIAALREQLAASQAELRAVNEKAAPAKADDESADDEAEDAEGDDVDLEDLTKPQLKAYIEELGGEVHGNPSKAELLVQAQELSAQPETEH